MDWKLLWCKLRRHIIVTVEEPQMLRKEEVCATCNVIIFGEYIWD